MRRSRSLASLTLIAVAGTIGIVPAASVADDHTATLRISEIRIDQSGADDDEYLELAGDPGTSLDGLTYVVIGDGAAAAGSGVIEAVVDLDGQALDALGRFVAAESTFALGTADLTTSLNFENGDNVTHTLVAGWSGAAGADLDTDDDGEIDAVAWDAVVDAIGVVATVDGGDALYTDVTVGPNGSFAPAHVFRCDGDWAIGAFGAFTHDTPGAGNCAAGDVGATGTLLVAEGGGDPDPEPEDPCEPTDVTPIHAVQGDGWSSPLRGDEVTIEGIVVADYQERGELGGFHVQEQDDETDGDPSTSEGVFVYGFWDAVSVGDRVIVSGTAEERFGQTQIGGSSTVVCGTGSVTPTTLDLPATDVDREAVEGMLLAVDAGLTVTELYGTGRYGEIWLSADGVLWQPTELVEPGSQAVADLETSNDRHRILLDDARTGQNLDPNRWLSAGDPIRIGDEASSFVAVMGYGFGEYRLQPVEEPTFSSLNPRPEVPDVGGSVQVASFNVLNYFTTIDDGSDHCAFACRGADSEPEFRRQRAKILAAISQMDADVVGVIEIENNGYDEDSAIADLVAGLNDLAGEDVWAFVDPGVERIGTDAIAVGLVYRTDVVDQIGEPAILDSGVDPRFNDQKNRPVLAATFNHRGDFFTVAVNHLKSKGSSCAPIGDPDTGDGQGNCNLTRTAAAEAEADWLASNPTGFDDPDVLVIGDLNAYRMEDPVGVFTDAGYGSLVEAPSWTYVFRGEVGTLDHILGSAAIAAKVTDARVWNLNAAEAPAYDYNSYNQDSFYAPDPYRSSDHDAVIVGLDLRPPGHRR